MPTKQVGIGEVVFDPELLPRGRREEVIEDYTDKIRRYDFPPIKAVFDGKTYWGYDGLQTYSAHSDLGDEVVRVEFVKGTRADVAWLAAGSNRLHGMPLSSAEKRRAVELCRKSELGKKKSQPEVADHVGCSISLVASVDSALKKQETKKPSKPASQPELQAVEDEPDEDPMVLSPPKPPTKRGRKNKAVKAAKTGDKLPKDRRGHEVPEFLRDVAAETILIQGLQTAASSLAEKIEAIKGRCPSGAANFVDISVCVGILKELRMEIDKALFYAACPNCEKKPKPIKTCESCKGLGWLTYAQFSQHHLNVA